MIVIIIIGFLSSLSLKKMLHEKGQLENRIWLQPLREAALFSLIISGVGYGASFLINQEMPPAAAMILTIISSSGIFINLMCIALYCSRLSRILKTVKALPNTSTPTHQDPS